MKKLIDANVILRYLLGDHPEYSKKAKEVIEKNLATVQQIACTLGEHMAETEVLLRSIAKDYAADDYDKPNVTIRNKRD